MPTRNLANVIPDDDSDDQTQATTPTQQATNTQSPTQTEETSGVTATNAPQQATQPTEKKPRKTGRTGGRKTPRSNTPTASASTHNPVQQASPGGQQQSGRPRIPKTGPTTRVTLDLALTEQRALEKLAGQLGRATDRDRGKNRIYPQHLIRVAARRLLTDEAFRQAVTTDLAEGRDELKRERK